MSRNRLEIKVGFFVLMCLIILGVLMIQFSKGTTFVRPTYTVFLQAPNIGGLRVRASVLMSGVQIGTVAGIVLSPGGTNVAIALKIYKPYQIDRGARFAIEQFGFLGDQYVAIYNVTNTGAYFKEGDQASADAPFNMQEFTRNASGFILRLDNTAKKLNDAIDDVRRVVLNEQTLTNVAFTVGTLRQVSENAMAAVQSVTGLIETNRAPVQDAVSNLAVFSSQLNGLAASGQGVINSNAAEIAAAVSNIVASTKTLTNILDGVEAGHGLAGSLLKNEELSGNVSLLASNLAMTSSNLNQQGLWRMLFGFRKPSPPPLPAATTAPGRAPFK